MENTAFTALPGTPQRADTGSLLLHYEAIERVSCSMLEAAQASDWSRVTSLEDACRLLISHLKQAAGTPLTAAERKRKADIMRRILVNDAKLRALAEPELDRIANLVFRQPAPLLH